MSYNENSPSSNKYSEWEAQVVQHNQKLDELIIELLIEDHPPKSRRGYCD